MSKCFEKSNKQLPYRKLWSKKRSRALVQMSRQALKRIWIVFLKSRSYSENKVNKIELWMRCKIHSTWQRIIWITKILIYSWSDRHRHANRLNLTIRTKLIQIWSQLSSYQKLNSINYQWLISILKLWGVLSSPRLGATVATKQLMPNQGNQTTLALL